MKEKFKNIKNIKLYIILLIVASILVIVGLTYAFFAPGGLFGDAADVTITTDDVAQLTFTKGSDISLVANLANFSEGAGNITGSTTSRVNFTGTEGSTEKYNVYFNIELNEYNYSTVDNSPEILLTVIGPDGNPVTEIAGYNYVTVGSVSGFDITNKKGLITIKEDYIITGNASNNEMHEWNVSLTYLNLDVDQGINEGKTLNSKLILQKNKMEYAGNYIAEISETSSDIYYHDASLLNGANDNSYRYTGANPDNYVCFGSDEEICPDVNMHRILGVFDNKLKLVASRGYIFDVQNELLTPIANSNYDYRRNIIKLETSVDITENYCEYPQNLLSPMKPTDNQIGYEYDAENMSNHFIDLYLINSYKKYNNMISKEKINIGEITADFNPSNFQISENAKGIYNFEKSAVTTNSYSFNYISYSEYMYAVDENYWAMSALENSDSSGDYYKNDELENNNWLYLKNNLYNTFMILTNNILIDISSKDVQPLPLILSNNIDYFKFDTITPEILANSKTIVYPTFYLKESVSIVSGKGTINNPYRLYDLDAIDYDLNYPDIHEADCVFVEKLDENTGKEIY